MAIITSQQVHARNWIKCDRCDGGAALTERDHKRGAVCTNCDNKGEVPRHLPRNIWAGYSSFYERQAGA
jgi:uncharacterized paraquat-inducible protein A